jgi:hypothetical protein
MFYVKELEFGGVLWYKKTRLTGWCAKGGSACEGRGEDSTPGQTTFASGRRLRL